MSRKQSYTALASMTYNFQDNADGNVRSGRPTLTSFGSAVSGLGVSSSRGGKAHGGRKRKHRVVNLRKRTVDNDELESVSGEGSTVSGTVSSAPSEFAPQHLKQDREDELTTPPRTPEKPQRPWQHLQADFEGIDLRDTPPRLWDLTPRQPIWREPEMSTPRPASDTTPTIAVDKQPSFSVPSSSSAPPTAPIPPAQPMLSIILPEKGQPGSGAMPFHPSSSSTNPNISSLYPEMTSGGLPQGRIFEQAWMLKMAGEIARKINEEKASNQRLWHRREEEEPPPPAYGS